MMSRIRSSISPEKNSRAPSSSRILWPKNVHADQLGVGGHRPTNFSHKSKDAQYNFPSFDTKDVTEGDKGNMVLNGF